MGPGCLFGGSTPGVVPGDGDGAVVGGAVGTGEGADIGGSGCGTPTGLPGRE